LTLAGRSRLPLRLAPAAVLVVVAVAGCSSDRESSPTTSPTTSAARLTEITGPIPAPTVTVPVVTQPVPAASTAPTAAPPTAAPGTTATAGPTCDPGVLFAALKASLDLPPDTGAQPPACAEGWATMVVGAPNQERNLAVFATGGGATWRFVDIGTEGVCSGAKVPTNLFEALGCSVWES